MKHDATRWNKKNNTSILNHGRGKHIFIVVLCRWWSSSIWLFIDTSVVATRSWLTILSSKIPRGTTEMLFLSYDLPCVFIFKNWYLLDLGCPIFILSKIASRWKSGGHNRYSFIFLYNRFFGTELTCAFFGHVYHQIWWNHVLWSSNCFHVFQETWLFFFLIQDGCVDLLLDSTYMVLK